MGEKSQMKVNFTTRDRLLRSWENSMELVRDFSAYSTEVADDKEVSDVFSEFAEDEGLHAAKLYEILREYDKKCNCNCNE